MQNLPKFLAETAYEEPADPLNTNYSHLTPERLGFFQRMTTDTLLSKSFSGFMSGFAEFRLDWTEIYDIKELLRGFEFNDTRKKLLVDIGGSREYLHKGIVVLFVTWLLTWVCSHRRIGPGTGSCS